MPAINKESNTRLPSKQIHCYNNPILKYDIDSSQCIFKVDLQTLHEDEQMALLSQKDSMGYNTLMFAAKYQPDALPTLLNAIQKLPKNEQIALFSQKNDFGDNALMLAQRHQPDALTTIFNAIQILSAEEQVILLSQKNLHGSSILMQQILKRFALLPLFTSLNIIRELPQDKQIALLSERDHFDVNIIMHAAASEANSLAELLDLIKALPADEQLILLSKDDNSFGHNIFMFAAQFQPNSLPCLLSFIKELSTDKQLTLLSQNKNYSGNTILMIAAKYQPNSLSHLLSFIKELPEDQKIVLLSQKNRYHKNILMFTADHQLDAQPIILDVIHQLSLSNQVKILSQQEFNASLKHNISSLKATGLEGAIKQCLQAMHYNKTDKQIAVLDALNEIKKTHADDIDTAITKAINDKTNPLYHALNIKRYPFDFFRPANSETGSLQKIKNISLTISH